MWLLNSSQLVRRAHQPQAIGAILHGPIVLRDGCWRYEAAAGQVSMGERVCRFLPEPSVFVAVFAQCLLAANSAKALGKQLPHTPCTLELEIS
jgi:hypothetical protein